MIYMTFASSSGDRRQIRGHTGIPWDLAASISCPAAGVLYKKSGEAFISTVFERDDWVEDGLRQSNTDLGWGLV
jgi:hypothetical protein